MTEHVWDLTGAEPVWRPLTDEEKAKLRAVNPNIRFVDAEVNGRRTRAALFTESSGQTYVSAGKAQTIDWAQPSDLTSWQPDASNGSAGLCPDHGWWQSTAERCPMCTARDHAAEQVGDWLESVAVSGYDPEDDEDGGAR